MAAGYRDCSHLSLTDIVDRFSRHYLQVRFGATASLAGSANIASLSPFSSTLSSLLVDAHARAVYPGGNLRRPGSQMDFITTSVVLERIALRHLCHCHVNCYCS